MGGTRYKIIEELFISAVMYVIPSIVRNGFLLFFDEKYIVKALLCN